MTTEKPKQTDDRLRITLTVTPEIYKTLSDMSDLFGKPMSKIVLDLLVDAHPALKKMVNLGKKVQGYQSKIGDMFASKRGVNVD